MLAKIPKQPKSTKPPLNHPNETFKLNNEGKRIKYIFVPV